MDERVAKLKTVENCVTFEKNATALKRFDLAIEARKRAIELKAEKYGAKSSAEKECLEAVYAYEQALSFKNGKKTSASRTWQMIDRHGVLEAVDRAVNRPVETMGYTALLEMGLQEYAFEEVVSRHPELFSPDAVIRSQARIKEWKLPSWSSPGFLDRS